MCAAQPIRRWVGCPLDPETGKYKYDGPKPKPWQPGGPPVVVPVEDMPGYTGPYPTAPPSYKQWLEWKIAYSREWTDQPVPRFDYWYM